MATLLEISTTGAWDSVLGIWYFVSGYCIQPPNAIHRLPIPPCALCPLCCGMDCVTADNHRSLLKSARRIVVKVGSGVVCNAAHEFDARTMLPVLKSMAGLVGEGRQVVLVSSGAVTLGAAELGLHRARLRDASVTRACASAGQCLLMDAYSRAFRRHKLSVAQVLLTEDDFIDLPRYQTLRQTFEKLLKLGAVPMVNENDPVSTIWTARAPAFRDHHRLPA